MNNLIVLSALALLSAYGFFVGRKRALFVVEGHSVRLHSRPPYYGLYVALWCAVPALLVMIGWLIAEPVLARHFLVAALPADIQSLPIDRLNLVVTNILNLASGNITSGAPTAEAKRAAAFYGSFRQTGSYAMTVVLLVVSAVTIAWGYRRIAPDFRARRVIEKAITTVLVLSSVIAVLTTVGIVLSLLFESFRFFQLVAPLDFLFGMEWSPQTALRADQVGSSGLFGAVPLFAGTLLISLIAMTIAAPVGLLSAIYLAEYAAPKFRATAKPLLEVLAGIPTVVYGFFAALVMAPALREGGGFFGLDISSESALAAGFVMGIMIIPFVSSISDDIIAAVPQALREGSYGLGATKSETILRVVLPAALPGIVGGLLLAISRAIGETMIVVMAAGLAANMTANPFAAVTTVTVQIVTLLVGDQEFDSAETLAAFTLGLTLFFITLVLNVVAFVVVNKYREQYE